MITIERPSDFTDAMKARGDTAFAVGLPGVRKIQSLTGVAVDDEFLDLIKESLYTMEWLKAKLKEYVEKGTANPLSAQMVETGVAVLLNGVNGTRRNPWNVVRGIAHEFWLAPIC